MINSRYTDTTVQPRLLSLAVSDSEFVMEIESSKILPNNSKKNEEQTEQYNGIK